MSKIQKILVFGGNWAHEPLIKIAQGINPKAAISYEFHASRQSATLLEQEFKQAFESLKTASDMTSTEAEVIRRCRMLRSISQTKALRYYRAMDYAWSRVLEHHSPDLVLTELIDSYVPHLLLHQCKARKIENLGLVTSVINGYCRATTLGELIPYRKPTRQEVDRELNKLMQPNYRPAFVQQSKSNAMKALGNWLRLWLSFGVRRLEYYLPDRHFSNHITGIAAKDYRTFPRFPRLKIGEDAWKSKLAANEQIKVFVPLQVTPEATIDYWCEDLSILDSESVILKLIEKHKDKIYFVIKEHPNAQGIRSSSFYRKILKSKNALLVPTSESAEAVFPHVDAILTWTGSVGLQAALLKKPVLTFCHPYYYDAELMGKIKLDSTSSSIISELERIKQADVNEQYIHSYFARVMGGHIPHPLRFLKEEKESMKYSFQQIGYELNKLLTKNVG